MPTWSRSGDRATIRASAARIGSLKSTLTVPGATTSASWPSGRTSKRACTPQQPLKLSNRSAPGSLVTTGSVNRRDALPGGV